MTLKLLDIAQIELDEAFEYYEALELNLGYRFVSDIEEAIKRIKQFPNAWHPLSTNTRRCLAKNFPYGIIYQIKIDHIVVIAIANLHKKPNYWFDRLDRNEIK